MAILKCALTRGFAGRHAIRERVSLDVSGRFHNIPRIFALAAANSASSRTPSSCRAASSLRRSAVDAFEGWVGGSGGIAAGCGAAVRLAAVLPRIVWAACASAWPTSVSSEFVLAITWTSWSVVIVRVDFLSNFF